MNTHGKIKTYALLATVLMGLAGCSTHCSCPPQTNPTPTTIIHEEPRE